MRIVLAVVAGVLTTVVLAFGIEAGGYGTGRFARQRFLLAAMILAGVAWVLTLTTLVPATTVPFWYKSAALVLLIPCTIRRRLPEQATQFSLWRK